VVRFCLTEWEKAETDSASTILSLIEAMKTDSTWFTADRGAAVLPYQLSSPVISSILP